MWTHITFENNLCVDFVMYFDYVAPTQRGVVHVAGLVEMVPRAVFTVEGLVETLRLVCRLVS